jgi:hypothetical protein
MDAQETTTDVPGRQQWNKELRMKGVAVGEEGEDNQQWHQRTKQETEGTSAKREDIV